MVSEVPSSLSPGAERISDPSHPHLGPTPLVLLNQSPRQRITLYLLNETDYFLLSLFRRPSTVGTWELIWMRMRRSTK